MTQKIKYAKWSLLRVCLHNAVTLCNWVWPMTVSPLKSRNYRGDLALEAKFFKAITGEEMTQEKIRFSCRAYLYVASCLHGKTDANQRYA